MANSHLDDLYAALQGRWRTVYTEMNGEMTDPKEFSTIVLENKGNKFTVEKAGVVTAEGTYSVYIKTIPYQLIYIYSKGPDCFMGGPRPGLFRIIGNTFKTCMGAVGHPVPDQLATAEDSESVLSIYQREGATTRLLTHAAASRAVSQW